MFLVSWIPIDWSLSIDPKKILHAHSNAHRTPKPVAVTIFMLDTKFNWNVLVSPIFNWNVLATYRLIQKKGPIDWPQKIVPRPL